MNNKAADTNKVITDKADTTVIDNTNSIENNQVNGTAPHVIEKVTETQQLINKKGVNLYGTFTRFVFLVAQLLYNYYLIYYLAGAGCRVLLISEEESSREPGVTLLAIFIGF